MEGKSKKPKFDTIQSAAAAIRAVPTDHDFLSEAALRDLFTTLTVGLGPGGGLIGTIEEEADWYAPPEDEVPEIATGEVIPDAKIEPQSQAASKDEPMTKVRGDQAKHDDDHDDEVEGEEEGEKEEEQDQDSNTSEVVEETGEYEDIEGVEEEFTDLIELPDGTMMHVRQYYGSDYEARIVALHKVKPMELPPHMPTRPHDYQLKGASQIDHSCKSKARGILVGDGMGLGKTLQAILNMHLIKGEPGLFLVLCPASLCEQWVNAIHGAFDEGHGLSAIHLKDSSMSAHQILAGGYDVVVCSYEFAEASHRKTQEFEDGIEHWGKRGDRNAMKPKRPTAALASGLWKALGLPFKRGYMDEAQSVNKRDGRRHKAIMELHVESWVIMSGTLPHNRWHDISGYLDFIKGHPYTTHDLFMRQFARSDHAGGSNPSIAQLRLLQRFLQAFLIMRPRSVIQLPPCERVAFPLKLNWHTEEVVTQLTAEYKLIAGMQDEIAPGDSKADINTLGKAIRAQLYVLHPLLCPPKKDDEEFTLEQEDIRNTTAEQINEKNLAEDPNAAEKRRLWLETLATWDEETLFNSPHVQALTAMIHSLVRDRPLDKIVVFSQYLKYLDIINAALKSKYNITCHRFDGSVPQRQRTEIQKKFADPARPQPLLMTAGAGSVGLNLTMASIMIQTEEWWNASTEAQAVCRIVRQGQEKVATVIKFHVVNSAIDGEISRVRRSKVVINTELVEALIHQHDEVPEPVKLLY